MCRGERQALGPLKQLTDILKMVRMHRLTFMAVSLILGVGGLQSAGAQDAQPTAATDSGAAYPQRAPVKPAVSPDGRPIAAGDWAVQPSSLPDGDARPASSAPERLEPLVSDHGIRYLSGGVGDSERAELDAVSNQFNLRLLFAMQGSGEYLAAVRVNILDAHGGTVLTAESQGPWFFAQLPPGDYVVDASTPGQGLQQPQRQEVHVGDSGQSRLDFRWR
jgi:hypothetical protein